MSRRKQSKPRHVDNDGLTIPNGDSNTLGDVVKFTEQEDEDDRVKFLDVEDNCDNQMDDLPHGGEYISLLVL